MRSTEVLSLSTRAKYATTVPAQKEKKRFEAEPASTAPTTLFVHGAGGSGQLGLGPDVVDEVARPRLHSKFTEGIQCLAAGGMHSLLIDRNGQLWSWGSNDDLALGRRTENVPDMEPDELEATPLPVEGLSDVIAVDADAGDCMSVVLGSQGEIRVWGTFRAEDGSTSFDGDPTHPPKVLVPQIYPALARHRICQVKCGASHILALTTDGHVFTWGFGLRGQLGRMEHHATTSLTPETLSLGRIVLIGAGANQSFAVDKDGVVFAWGLNHMHQLGLNSNEESVLMPTAIGPLNPRHHGGAKVIAIECGEFHTLFLLSNGELWGCGRCDEHALGLAPTHPSMLHVQQMHQNELPAIRARLADKFACSIDDPQIAHPKIDLHIREPVRIAFPPPPMDSDPTPSLPVDGFSETKIVSVSCGPRYSVACSEEGTLYAWGVGITAQLGLGPNAEIAETPTRVRSKGLKEYIAQEVSAGGQHVLVSATRNGSTP
ncbi:regulator of chromosome condensation 1/beta-lactamase-inhibitor protein II [Mucidula mucida]|nr:regulator of chromosome condensation 1/beta-lactamase-inhibitor protein II [Mucidula mucida]